MNFNQNTGAFGSPWQARDTSWLVGRSGGDQTWVVTRAGGGNIVLQQRTQSNPWHFIKVGANDVNMSGVNIHRNSLLNFGIGVSNQGWLFTDASGGQVGGTVTIGNYYLPNLFSSSANRVEMDPVGANLTVASGGKIQIQDDETSANAQAQDNEVTALRMLPGNALRVNGTGGVQIVGTNNLTNGRLGIYFAGGTLNSRGNLTLQGPKTFLYGTNSTIFVGGNVRIESRNAAGFSSLTASPTDATFDDFNLTTATLTMDGGALSGVKTMKWTTASAKAGPSLAASDFSLGNFTLGTYSISNSTPVFYTTDSALFLMTNLNVVAGSSLFMQGSSQIHMLDPDLSETNRITTYLASGQIQNAWLIVTDGLGFSLLGIPEPSTLFLLLAGSAIARWRSRLAGRRRNRP